jgi:hypothetical protein
MRKSIIAGLTFSAALTALAGQAFAGTSPPAPEGPVVELTALSVKESKPAKPVHHVRKPSSRIVVEQVPRIVEQAPRGELMRIPAHPIVRDCVHVFFPQCSRGYEGLNDGQFNRPYR